MTGHDPAGSWRLTPTPMPVPLAAPAAAPFAVPATAAPKVIRPVPSPAAPPGAPTGPEHAIDPKPATDPEPTGAPGPDDAEEPDDLQPDGDADRAVGRHSEADDFESTVRPYARVGGRTHVPAGLGLSIEALVRGLAVAVPEPAALTPEQRRILDLTATSYQSVAELSAHLKLPIGVIRVVLADLLAAGLIQVYGRSTHDRHGVGLDILEGVLDGISTL